MYPTITLVIGALLGYLIGFLYMRSQMYKDRKSHDIILEDGRRTVEKMKAHALSEVDEILAEKKEKADNETSEKKKKLDERLDQFYNKQKEIDSKWDLVESKQQAIQKTISDLALREENIHKNEIDLQTKIHREEKRLEALAGMNTEEAKKRFLETIELGLAEQEKELIRKSRHRVQEEIEQQAREQTFEIMQRYSGECSESRTTSTVYLPSDEIKGRIIGREGRNIRAIETLTGANILIDDTPETVVVSCFEPHRREIAKKTLETLIEDGRIHPNRIHEVVEQVRAEVNREMYEVAEGIVQELNIPGIPGNVIKQLGKLKFRFNSAQSVLHNCKEVSGFMGMIAAEFNMNVFTAKKIGLLHSIGKSFDEHTDDDFVKTGVNFLRKEGVEEEVCKAILMLKQVSNEETPYAQVLKTAVNLSSNRPGARDENMEFYIRRLHQMEHLVKGFNGVTDCMVMQAGREIIAHVNPDIVDDKRARGLTQEVARKLEEEMEFPGPVHVILVRESRTEETISE